MKKNGRNVPKDITYCYASCDCKNTDCGRHSSKLKKMERGVTVSVADFRGICREYISGVLDEIEKEKTL